jgi:hypothetical protein
VHFHDRLDAGGGVSVRIAAVSAARLSARNGLTPVSISYNITPSAKRSERASARFPCTCSGDM